MPGYRIIGYDCNDIIPAAGAIHCITKEIGTTNPVLISHARLQNTTDTVNNYIVNATIKNKSSIDSAFVFWRTDTTLPYNKIFMTNSGGQNWISQIPHQSAGKSVYYFIKAHTLNGKYFSKPITAPSGYWKFNVTGVIGVSENQNLIPKYYKLEQNYPNPFNPITKIKFNLPPLSEGGAQAVKLFVYDILGREVATLVNKKLNAGSYEVTFDGSGFSSGVYFYRLSTGDGAANFTDTRKMLLIK